MMVLHEAMNTVVCSLQEIALKGFVVEQEEWGCVPLVGLYSYDIPEGKDISAVRHVVAVKQHCVRCKVTEEIL